MDPDDVQAVEQVLPEAPVLDRRLEVLVRRGDDPRVDGVAPGRADRPDVLLLEHAQQLDLERGRKLGHLVEEDRPAVSRAEQAERVGHRPRERAADVTEELGFQEVGGTAPQLTVMKGPPARAESRWIAAATSSFPVPLSPSISTGESAGATRTIMPFTASIAGETLTSSLMRSCSPRRLRSALTSWRSRRRSRMWSSRWRSSSRTSGLVR